MLSTSEETDTLIVFVHGHRGSPKRTWPQFDQPDKFVYKFPWLRRCDLAFYGYDSQHTPLLSSAEELRKFLHKIYPEAPLSLLQPTTTAPVRTARTYSRIVLVGHSQGAAVIRIMLLELGFLFSEDLNAALYPGYRSLDEGSRKEDIVDIRVAASEFRRIRRDPFRKQKDRTKTQARRLLSGPKYAPLQAKVRLFAPAHCGALITSKLAMLIELLRRIYDIGRAKSIAAMELDSDGAVIRDLRPETGELATAFPWIPAFRASILWGDDDRRVNIQKFRHDDFEFLPGHTHTSICKPTITYDKPLSFVDYQYDERAKRTGI